jgi:hypothetical protein
MKKVTLILLFALLVSGTNLFAQRSHSSGGYGHTLNLGLGLGGYYGYYNYGHSLPVFSINYELDVARNFTLAPFVSFSTYRDDAYYYRETIIPIGVKGTYYFDQILGAGPNWDFYLAGSLGFSIVRETWDDGYSHDTYYHNVNPLFLDLHVGTEYHMSNRVGIFLDLSTGVSTAGLAFH